MCGIIGYVGKKQAPGILLDGLKKLEYRGYDSSGIAVLSSLENKISVRKTQGKIRNLQDLIKSKPFPKNSIGISHTRWATHGVPNKVNAHPHNDFSNNLSIVHNGIIENHEHIKEYLIQVKGIRPVSDTDSEMSAHLLRLFYRHCKGDWVAAVCKTVKRLEGSFALGVISTENPDTLVAVRQGSPLIIGLGQNENFIASDPSAVLEHTKNLIYLQDGQFALIKKDDVKIFDFDGKPVKLKVSKITFNVKAVKKQGYPHFMLKEIHQQPDVLKRMIKERIKDERVILDGLGLSDRLLKGMKHIVIVACGTAYHAGMVGRYLIESIAKIPVSVDVSSEFRYRDPLVNKKTLVIAISQSGETADTLAAVKEAESKGAKIVAICNVLGSSLARESNGVLYTHAGSEIGVASTKAYTAQLSMLFLMALKLGEVHKTLLKEEQIAWINQFRRIPEFYTKILKNKSLIARIARANFHFGCFLFLGRNVNYPSALEGALKLKEISYTPAEGYAAGEMKHGPIALIDEYRAVVCIATESDTYEKMISNIQEILSRKGKVIAIATEGNAMIKRHASNVIFIPKIDELLTPLLAAIPLQLIAYYISVKRGCDVDQPRNLAKSVTVE